MMRCPGIKPGSTAWKVAMLTTIPTSLVERVNCSDADDIFSPCSDLLCESNTSFQTISESYENSIILFLTQLGRKRLSMGGTSPLLRPFHFPTSARDIIRLCFHCPFHSPQPLTCRTEGLMPTRGNSSRNLSSIFAAFEY